MKRAHCRVTDREQAIGTLAAGSTDLQSQLVQLRYAPSPRHFRHPADLYQR